MIRDLNIYCINKFSRFFIIKLKMHKTSARHIFQNITSIPEYNHTV